MRYTEEELVEKGLTQKRESKYVEFKSQFDGGTKAWCDLVKEVIALANTQGGVVVYGLESGGTPSGRPIQDILDADPEVVVDKLARYTDVQFDAVSIYEREKEGQPVAALVVGSARVPIPFTQEGGHRQGSSFKANQIYFRHGAKSEPATRDDLRNAMERELERVREAWMENVRKVVRAPPGSSVGIQPPKGDEKILTGGPVRVTDDPEAKPTQVADPDATHPYRFTEVVAEVDSRLPDDVSFNRHDLIAIRQVHDLMDDESFVHQFQHATPQYSEKTIDWIVEQHQADEDFFDEARERYSR